MIAGTSKRTLQELLAIRRTVGVHGAEVVLTTPTALAEAAVKTLLVEAAPGGKFTPDADGLRQAVALATEAVASTLLVEGEDSPSGDRVQAGRLIVAATRGEDGKEIPILDTDLVRGAMEMCGCPLALSEQPEEEEPAAAKGPTAAS